MRGGRSHPLGLPDADGSGVLSKGSGNVERRAGTATVLDRWLVRQIAAVCGNPPVQMALWDDTVPYAPAGKAFGKLVFGDRGALWACLTQRELGFGDCYSAGRISVQGDLVEVLYHIYRAVDIRGAQRFKRNMLGRLPKPKVNSRAGSQENIHHHYDLGNDFYRLWLDERLLYTCAYYPSPEASLEEAQLAKLDHVARKLCLKPGQQVVEAGCGWGALAMHLAENYGVSVTAYNISREQLAYAREESVRRGISGRVEFVEDDYRNIEGTYDAFVSVGMLEHVGLDHFEELGGVVNRVLRHGGKGLIHSVGRSHPCAVNAWLERRIFPGSHPPALSEMMAIFQPYRFSVMDVENLRLHYAQTLMEWLRRFDAHREVITGMYDEHFARAWRLYLGGCAAGFLSGGVQLFQVLFAHADDNALPTTRAHLYQPTTNGRGKPEAPVTPRWYFGIGRPDEFGRDS